MAKIKDLPKFKRPREKLAIKGPSALKREELLAILLRTGYEGKDVLQLAKLLAKRFPRDELLKVNFSELKKFPGVGPTKAAIIVSSLELAKRMLLKPDDDDVFINSPQDAISQVENLRKATKEHLVCLYLDASNRLVHKETVSIGTLNANLVHPREVFEPAIKHLAARVVLLHNHPSGNSKPSEADMEITSRLVEVAKILGIEVIDHIIITNKDFTSLKDRGDI